MKTAPVAAVVLLTFLVLCPPVSAEGEAPSEEQEEERLNEMSLFLGGTTKSGEGSGFSGGLEYERHIASQWGVGGLVEVTGGDLRDAVFALPVFWHPGAGWKLMMAPGFEVEKSDEEDCECGSSGDKERSFLLRVGGAYDFELSEKFGLAPEVCLDLIEGGEQAWVFGLNFGVSW